MKMLCWHASWPKVRINSDLKVKQQTVFIRSVQLLKEESRMSSTISLKATSEISIIEYLKAFNKKNKL